MIIDSGVRSGIELSCSARKLKLIGVNVQSMVKFPLLNPTEVPRNTLSSGHTHIFSISDPAYKIWGEEAKFKFELA